MYRHSGDETAAVAAGEATSSSGMVSFGGAVNYRTGRFLHSGNHDRSTATNKPPPYWNKSHPGVFYFDRANQNPTQAQVDEFFRQQPELSSPEIVSIFLRAVQWKKKKGIDVLGDDKLSFVTERLWQMMSKLDGRQFTQTAMATVNGLQAISPTNIHMSGQWVVVLVLDLTNHVCFLTNFLVLSDSCIL